MGKKTKNSILSVEHNYTDEEITSIKANLKRAFDVDFIPVDISLGNVLKNNISNFNFIVGEQYILFNSHQDKEMGIEKGWHILEVTYQRLDLVFFKILTSNKPKKEHYANKGSMFVERLIPVNFDITRFGIPEKNLPLLGFEKGTNNPFDVSIITPSKTYTI